MVSEGGDTTATEGTTDLGISRLARVLALDVGQKRIGLAVSDSLGLTAQGLDVLKRGGSAVDAAIAANAVLCLTEPVSCGVGGDLFALVWDAKTKKLYGLNASGAAPYRATRQLFADRGLTAIPTFGPLSWSVPGCVGGWAALHERLPADEALRCALSGGDDYRLAFTLPPSERAALQAEFPEIAVIGRVEAGEGVHLYDEQGRELALAARGYQHFG